MKIVLFNFMVKKKILEEVKVNKIVNFFLLLLEKKYINKYADAY